MKNGRPIWSCTGVAALAGLAMAATAAFAYEGTEEAPSASLLKSAQQLDPGIDFIITGPTGPSKPSTVRPETSASRGADRPVRHRMRLE